MSNKITTTIKYMQMPNVPKQVLNELADFADDDGKAFPSIPTLAAVTCLSERSVRNGIAWLVEQKLISKILGNGGNNIYFLHPENFNGEFKYPASIKYAPLHDVPPCTKLTPVSPATTPAPDAFDPCTTLHTPLHDVPTNHHITINNHQSNHQDIHEPETPPQSDKPKQIKKTKSIKTGLPENFEISTQVQTWAAQKGFDQLDQHLENFLLVCEAKGYQYANWDAAFKTAIRDDWAKLRTPRFQNASQLPTKKDINAEYWASFGQQRQQQDFGEPVDITPKKSNWIEGVGHA
ncbi:MAG: helix-turn-helix domain-containing protein [Acinetobacter sp.]